MAESEILTPATTSDDTSTNAEPTAVDTSAVEPEAGTDAAKIDAGETMVSTQEKGDELIAGKFKTQEELVKAYKETEKFIGKSAELEKELNTLKEQQAKEAEQVQQNKLKEAQNNGFNSVEEQEIANRVQLAEFELYANSLNLVEPENLEAVRDALINYYNTGNKAYLSAAKRWFGADVIEAVRDNVKGYENRLKNELNAQIQSQKTKRDEELGQMLKTEFAEFLSDISTNSGKAQALNMFCNAGFINSKEDMQTFEKIYSDIANFAKEAAIKEYEAQKAIELEKEKATIQGGNGYVLDSVPTYAQLSKMSQAQYNAAVAKYGLEKILLAK